MRWRLPSMSGSATASTTTTSSTNDEMAATPAVDAEFGTRNLGNSNDAAAVANVETTTTTVVTEPVVAADLERDDGSLLLPLTLTFPPQPPRATMHDTPASATHPATTAGGAAASTAAASTAATMPAPRLPTYSIATSSGGDTAGAATADHALVHKFDLSKYKDGKYMLIPASAREQIRYTGRFLHHGSAAKRKSKVNTVQFDWPGVEFELTVRGSNTVAIRLKGDGNYFNVFVNGAFRCILKASPTATCCEVATDLDPTSAYTVTVTKRTEPQMRGAMSTFKVCTFYGFIVEATAEVLPCRPPPRRTIEFIGDSVTTAFGNEGMATTATSRFGSTKGRMANVYNGYACIVARMFNAEAHILAWSGKGVLSNAGDWGPNLPALWQNTIASRDNDAWDMTSWTPDVVVVNIGVNDLFPPASLETEIVSAYAQFLIQVRQLRPHAHIFCVAFDEHCMSAEYSETNRSHVALQLQEIVRVALSRVSSHDDRMHYAFINVDGGLDESDYATLRHHAVSGHVKIAELLAAEIAPRVQWRIESPPTTMPYPQEKHQILMPKDSSSCTIC